MAGVFKEIFTSIILSLFYPDASWLQELTSMDHMVDNNAINLAEVGADPDVVVDNNVWPLVPLQRTDTGIRIPLATFDTKPTHVTNVDEMETAYDKAESVVRQHTNTLYTRACKSAAYNISPTAHTAATPLLKTTGVANSSGYKALTYNDITDLSLAFDNGDLPQQGRILLLSPQHKKDLKVEDIKLYKQMMTDREIDGFKIYTFTGNPKYNASTGAKMPYGSATGNPSSIAIVTSEAMRAMGTIEGEPEKRWADYRGWLLGFQMRFVALPFRAFGYGAVYSDNA
ncbi:MAG: hypothetical protein LBE91_14835 [Tannerella sp.]|jgi:hypothetical protein|nr:hypothetical protein [Tannerella sp.]